MRGGGLLASIRLVAEAEGYQHRSAVLIILADHHLPITCHF